MLNLSIPINELSYGLVGRNILDALLNNGVQVSVFNIGPISKELQEKYREVLDKPVIEGAPSLCIFHDHHLDQHAKGSGKKIGFPIFELDNFSDQSKQQLAEQDLVLVCSEWARSVIKNTCGDLNCSVVKLGVDTETFHYLPSVKKEYNSCIFLNIGKYEIRKGHDLLPKIFNTAFPNGEDVKLWMLAGNPFLSEKNFQKIRRFYSQELGNRVILLESGLRKQDLNYLMNKADCGVYPYKTEGWCFVPETTLLTNAGVVKIKDVKPGDIITDHLGKRSKVNKVLVQEVDQDILEIKTVGSPPVKITTNHSVLVIKNNYSCHKLFKKQFDLDNVSPEWCPARTLKKGDYLMIPKYQTNSSYVYQDKNTTINLNNELMRLFGYYVAEGSGSNNCTTFSFHQKESVYHDDVTSFIKKYFGVYPTITYQNRNRCCITFHSTLLTEMLHSMFGRRAGNKRVPYDFLFLPTELQKEFLIGVFRGDGTKRGFRYSTVSPTLGWQVKQMLINIGCKPTLQIHKKKKHQDEYSVNIKGLDRHKINFDNIDLVDGLPRNHTKFYKNYVLTPIVSVKHTKYSGEVYNLEMNGEHTYNINGFAVHNCMPLLESMAAGQQVIATNYSGPTAYLSEKNAYLVSPGEEMIPAVDNIFFHGNVGRWPNNNTDRFIEEFANKMREVYIKKREGKILVNNHGIETARGLSWDSTAKRIIEIINSL